MGNFSWITKEGRQIVNTWCKCESWRRFTVYMHAPDGRVWEEKDYGGYGEFGGKDYYVLMAEINGEKNDDDKDALRSKGIELAFSERTDLKWPVLSECAEWTGSFDVPNESDPDQGDVWDYPDSDDEEESDEENDNDDEKEDNDEATGKRERDADSPKDNGSAKRTRTSDSSSETSTKPCEHLGVTREQFEAYRRVQKGGLYNMLDSRAVASTGLSQQVYFRIIEKYAQLQEAFCVS